MIAQSVSCMLCAGSARVSGHFRRWPLAEQPSGCTAQQACVALCCDSRAPGRARMSSGFGKPFGPLPAWPDAVCAAAHNRELSTVPARSILYLHRSSLWRHCAVTSVSYQTLSSGNTHNTARALSLFVAISTFVGPSTLETFLCCC